VLNSPLSPWPSYSSEEVEAVKAVVESNKVNYWTGEQCRQFEQEFSNWVGCSHSVAVANGTLALDLALKALDIGPGDEVIVTPRTFIASVSCVINAGATPVFADVDQDSGNISPATIERSITAKSKAVIPVHLAGWPCDMIGIMALADRYNLKVIEDCAQSHGAMVGGRHVGTIGHVGAWSFCQDKIMTTAGEGGMVTTNDPDLWEKMWSFKDHGKTWDAVYAREHPPGFRWVHERFGTNWRMLEVQAAVGRIQLRRMAAWTKRRMEIAMRLRDALMRFPNLVRVPLPSEAYRHAYYRLYAYVRAENLPAGWDRDRIVAECNAHGAPAYQGSCSEVYLERAFDGTPWRPKSGLPVAQRIGADSIMFLVHPTITDAQLHLYAEGIEDVFRLIA
jgi:dTDP-4-amino-4,6-dideoxygalactose transaminase